MIRYCGIFNMFTTSYRYFSKLLDLFRNKKNRSREYKELMNFISYFNNKKKNPSILYFGDSVCERISRHDVNTCPLAELVKKKLEDYASLEYITHSAYHSIVYYYFLRIFQIFPAKPRLIIIPINIRSFSPQWDLNPAWQFNDEINILRKFLKNPNIDLHLPDITDKEISYDKFNEVKIRYPMTDFDTIGKFRKLIDTHPGQTDEKKYRLKQIFIYHYMHKLKASNRKLRFFKKIDDYLSEKYIKHIFYLTPINYQAGIRIVGDYFNKVIDQNINTVKKIIHVNKKRRFAVFKDYSKLFQSDLFFHSDLSTEHLNEKGRILLAEKIVSDVKDFYY